MVIDFQVKNLGDLELRFSIDFNWKWGRLYMVQDDVSDWGFQLGYMEDGVNGAHTVRKMKSVGLFTGLGNNQVGSEKLVW